MKKENFDRVVDILLKINDVNIFDECIYNILHDDIPVNIISINTLLNETPLEDSKLIEMMQKLAVHFTVTVRPTISPNVYVSTPNEPRRALFDMTNLEGESLVIERIVAPWAFTVESLFMDQTSIKKHRMDSDLFGNTCAEWDSNNGLSASLEDLKNKKLVCPVLRHALNTGGNPAVMNYFFQRKETTNLLNMGFEFGDPEKEFMTALIHAE